MPTTRTQTVRYIRKGDTGDRGERGASLRGPQAWSDCASGYAFQSGAEGEAWVDVVLYGDQTYVCKTAHAKSATNYPGSAEDVNGRLWQLGDRIDLVATKILLATYALVKNLGVEAIEMKDADGNLLFMAKDGSVTCRTGTFENVTISGQLKGVTGSFHRLTCENNEGDEVGSIAFGNDGRMWIEGDLFHQGYNSGLGRGYRFYTSDLWCRGMFGAVQRTVLRVSGSMAYVYGKDLSSLSGYSSSFSLESKTDSSGNQYYVVPTYITTGDDTGMPVDIVAFRGLFASPYNYLISMMEGQRVLLVNAYNSNNNVRFYCNGSLITLNGGAYRELCKLSQFQYPKQAETTLGAGIFMGTQSDIDW